MKDYRVSAVNMASTADSNLGAADSRNIVDNPSNLDLGAAGWSTIRGYGVASMPPHPSAPTTLGDSTNIGLNTVQGLMDVSRGSLRYGLRSRCGHSAWGPFRPDPGSRTAWPARSNPERA